MNNTFCAKNNYFLKLKKFAKSGTGFTFVKSLGFCLKEEI